MVSIYLWLTISFLAVKTSSQGKNILAWGLLFNIKILSVRDYMGKFYVLQLELQMATLFLEAN